MELRAIELNGLHVGMSVPIMLTPYVVFDDSTPLEYKKFVIYSEIRMITHTSKGLVKLRLQENGDRTLQPDTIVNLVQLPHRKPIEMMYGRAATKGAPIEVAKDWAEVVVYSDMVTHN